MAVPFPRGDVKKIVLYSTANDPQNVVHRYFRGHYIGAGVKFLFLLPFFFHFLYELTLTSFGTSDV